MLILPVLPAKIMVEGVWDESRVQSCYSPGLAQFEK
jgi:hypothetical protein